MVALRKNKNRDGSVSLFLDYRHNGKRVREYLVHLRLNKVVTPLDRIENKEKLKTAEAIQNKKAVELQSGDYDIIPDFKKDIDFVKYFETLKDAYIKKDKRIYSSCYNKFLEFLAERKIKSLSSRNVTESLVEGFKNYLEENLNGETPSNYFRKFKRVLRQGVKEKILRSNPGEGMSIKRNESITKDILTFEEIQKLASTPLTNMEIKKAFLFSCLSGLRFCDIKNLQWKHIHGSHLNIKQQKTDKPVSINLNRNSLELIGEPKKREDYIFHLPSHTSCLKNLARWCRNAGIRKKISWHCARHSFATNIILYGSDVNSASALLGHSSLVYIQRYVRIVESLKEKAVQNLPEIEITF